MVKETELSPVSCGVPAKFRLSAKDDEFLYLVASELNIHSSHLFRHALVALMEKHKSKAGIAALLTEYNESHFPNTDVLWENSSILKTEFMSGVELSVNNVSELVELYYQVLGDIATLNFSLLEGPEKIEIGHSSGSDAAFTCFQIPPHLHRQLTLLQFNGDNENGGIEFQQAPSTHIRVAAKKGMVLIFPSNYSCMHRLWCDRGNLKYTLFHLTF